MHQRSLAANNDVTPILTVTHPLGPEVCVLCLLLASIGAVHRIVLLKLHGLHLLLDGVHGDDEFVEVAEKIRNKVSLKFHSFTRLVWRKN